MSAEDWQKPFVRSLAFLLGGDAIPTPDERGQRIIGDALLVLLNAHHEPVRFTVPPPAEGQQWVLEFYTAEDAAAPEPVPDGPFELTGRSLAVFREAAARREPLSPQTRQLQGGPWLQEKTTGGKSRPACASGDRQGGGPA